MCVSLVLQAVKIKPVKRFRILTEWLCIIYANENWYIVRTGTEV